MNAISLSSIFRKWRYSGLSQGMHHYEAYNYSTSLVHTELQHFCPSRIKDNVQKLSVSKPTKSVHLLFLYVASCCATLTIYIYIYIWQISLYLQSQPCVFISEYSSLTFSHDMFLTWHRNWMFVIHLMMARGAETCREKKWVRSIQK
jgi:hypothetical protein